MTSPTPQENNSPAPAGPKPAKLNWVTTPLLVALAFNAIELLLLPFQGHETIRTSNKLASDLLKRPLPDLTDGEVQGMVWMLFVVMAAIITILYTVRQGVLEGRRWALPAALVIAVLSLPVLPLGSACGIFMLLGLFNPGVRAYLNR